MLGSTGIRILLFTSKTDLNKNFALMATSSKSSLSFPQSGCPGGNGGNEDEEFRERVYHVRNST